MKLTREVRMSLGLSTNKAPLNSWGGWPATDCLVPRLVVRLSVAGDISAETGMIHDIKAMDDLLRRIVPQVEFEEVGGAAFLLAIWGRLGEVADGMQIQGLELALSPQLRFRINQERPAMITVVHQFEFSAAHRLHSDGLSEQENREVFGKCNNPRGHGHNYVLDVAITGSVSKSGEVCSLEELQRVVKQRVIDRFDHKHLNEDCEEFASINPTVENIARRCWQLLENHFGTAKLTGLRLYETPKTWVDLDASSMETEE